MKKLIKKMKGKKVLSLVLVAIMLATTFNMALPMLKLDASAAGSVTTPDGETVTQTKIVDESTRYTTYDNYAARYLNGASNPTNMVIPGLQNSEDYVIQGMSYYPAKDWMLITAYHGDSDETGTVKSSKVFALDAATGEFVAMFSFLNPDGTANTEHGGGIAISNYNIYYACGDDDREIAYAPLSELDLAEGQTYKTIQLADSVDFNEIGSVTVDGKTGYTAYVCFDNGVLWTGNFYDEGVELIGGADFTEIANGYNAPANNDYNSMVFGYRLAGNSPEEEWNYLMGNVTGKDCRGNPSYVIGISNTLRDVQYAVVDNGKLYLSCSYGTGEGTLSVSYAGMNPYSSLVVADIDLSQPGTKETDIVTHNGTRTVKAHDIQNYKKFDMMPMSEGLCVVNDNIFITFESASYKYREKAGVMGNCGYPVDVVWQLDPYELMETTVAEPEKSIYYEKLHSIDDIVDGEEYIIVHESNQKDPVSQKNYLYALNAQGNFKGLELSKSSATNIYGYDGMIGHPITYYSFEKGINGEDILYLEHPEEDDIEDIRWTITKTGEGKYSIKNTSTYFANYNNFYFNENKITMSPNGADYLSNIGISQLDGYKDNGYFYLANFSNSSGYYLWCNDGLVDNYNTKANAYYTNNLATYPLLDGVTEVAGTFHCDAMNISGANILGTAIDTSDDDPNIPYEDGAFQIYRRVVDGAASTYESRVYTDLDAKLQEDGTYTVTLETYAISPNHYQYVGERPTDYIIVADTSSSMGEKGSTGYMVYPGGDLMVDKMSLEADTNNDKGKGNASIVIGYSFCNEDIYFKHTADDKFYKAYMAIRNEFDGNTLKQQYYYVYYIAGDGYYYCYTNQQGTPTLKYTEDEFKAWVAGTNGVLQTASSTRSNNNDNALTGDGRRSEILFYGDHYRFDDVNSSHTSEHVRLDTLKTAVNDLIDDIAAQNEDNRIALVQYGGTNGFYNTSGDFTTDDYANAFWSTGAKDELKTAVSALTTSTQTDGTGIELTYADNIIRSSGIDYKSDGAKNVAIIFLSDGIPGTEDAPTDCDGNITSVSTTADVAKTAANGVIAKAQTIKDSGAFIYTVLIGNEEVDGFSKKTYMDAVSSKYAAAESLDVLGGQSVDGVNYAVSLATTTMNNFLAFGEMTTEEVAHNTAVGLDNLDANSYLRQQLSNAFKFPADNADGTKNYNVAVELITGEFDEIGRFSFKESQADIDANAADAANIVPDINTTSKTLTITKYDYAKEYIAKNRTTDGRKLRVTITGLLADETADIQNTSINNTGTSAIYKTKTDMDGSDGTTDLSFKKLPTTYFNIPKYTYVLDYGLQLLDTDVNGTLKSVSADLSAQRDADGNLSYKDVSANGLVAIQEGDQNLLYHTTPTNSTDSGYVLIQRDDGTYDWFEIEVVPASNVYFEEDEMVVKDATATTKAVWGDIGNANNTNRALPDEDDVDGFDNAYNVQSDYSNGTTRTVTVDSSKRNSQTQTFDFKGTGIDIVSRCGSTTGMMLISVKQKVDDGNGGTKMKTVKASIVDTYCAEGTFNQTPIFSWSGDYGTYTVEIGAMYLTTAGALNPKTVNKSNLIDTGLEMTTSETFDASVLQAMLDEAGVEDVSAEDVDLIWFDDNSIFNGGSGVAPTKKGSRADTTSTVALENYIDGFRVYNPIDPENADYSAYKATERNVSYANVIENLAPVSSTDGSVIDELYGIAYITGLGEDETTVSFAKYKEAGPKGELYLNGGKAISFKIKRGENERVMLGLRAVNGTEATNVSINDGTGDPMSVNITSATEMYYDITNCIDTTSGEVVITITNNHSTNLLAVNHVKFSGGSGSNGTVVTPRSITRSADASEVTTNKFLPITQEDLVTIENSMRAEPIPAVVKNGVIVPLVEEDETPDDTTTPDAGDDNVNNDTNDDTNTDSDDKEFSIFSLIELLISIIEKILHNAFGTGSMA